MAKLMKWEIDHLERKVHKKVDPLIEDQELLIKQFKTEATKRAVDKLSKKMGADKILNQFRKAEEMLKQARADAKTFFQKKKPSDQELKYKFEKGQSNSWRSDEITLEDCEEQMREWAANLVSKELEKRPEGKELARLKQIRTCALDHVKESNINKDLPKILNNLFTQSLGITWNEEVKQLPSK